LQVEALKNTKRVEKGKSSSSNINPGKKLGFKIIFQRKELRCQGFSEDLGMWLQSFFIGKLMAEIVRAKFALLIRIYHIITASSTDLKWASLIKILDLSFLQ
jgi:hypothetical protein